MNCPVCKNTSLVMSDRSGVEIDYCPNCRGVWLDRGELDKIIERSSNHYEGKRNDERPPQSESEKRHDDRPSYSDDDKRNYSEHDKNYPPKKKKGFFGEMFDFD